MKLELKIVDLLARNAERKYTINEIAKALEGHYSLVHRTIKRMLEEGVIAKEQAGKAHLCSLNFASEKALTLIQLSEIERKNELFNSNKELKLILEDFVKSSETLLHAIFIVLFGSYAKEEATKKSDIDILLVSQNKAGVDKITKEMYAKYGKEINVIAVTQKEFVAQKSEFKEMLRTHFVLFGAQKFVSLVLK